MGGGEDEEDAWLSSSWRSPLTLSTRAEALFQGTLLPARAGTGNDAEMRLLRCASPGPGFGALSVNAAPFLACLQYGTACRTWADAFA